ncbi:hypothetical protein B0O99DRAFT_609073 [Bisporella sp. PMI_857]|nr:hypothetical protein B0O99DRAFT_609073 [Bisporella sp. PMI_857]
MHLNDFPPELLRQCLTNLTSQDDLHNASLVCRSWLTPVRDIYWSCITISLTEDTTSSLLRLLGPHSNISRRIGGILINGSDIEDEGLAAWQDGVLKVLEHFSDVKSLTIQYLDLMAWEEGTRGRVLGSVMVTAALVIQHLEAGEPAEVLPLVVGNPEVKFLGLGLVKFEGARKEDAEARADLARLVQLQKLRHLVVFSEAKGVWSELLPYVEHAPLENLNTVVLLCYDNERIARLIARAAPSLRSLALGFISNDTKFDLSQVKSLTNLSIDISSYSRTDGLLAGLLSTISSLPAVEQLFINVGPAILEPERQLDSAPPLWEALDAQLIQLPGLKTVVFTQVLDSCLGFMINIPGVMGGMFNKWKDDILVYAQGKLPRYHENGVIVVKQIVGSWTSQPFADFNIPSTNRW